MLAQNGALTDMIDAGARILESACGPCIGMGQSPKSGAVSLRTFNRNFKGRSGTLDADVYLVSPETAALSAITGVLTDGQDAADKLGIIYPEIDSESFEPGNSFIVYSDDNSKANTDTVMGPNIKPFPMNVALPEKLQARIVLKTGDNITTDDIMPSDSRLLPYRSNIPYLSGFCFEKTDSEFAVRAKEAGNGIIIGGENYGQGSSREHAALAPLYLGIRIVIAKSFARIHRSNLINSGILPLTFKEAGDYQLLNTGNELVIENARTQLDSECIIVKDAYSGAEFKTEHSLSELEKQMILAGGKINLIKSVDKDK